MLYLWFKISVACCCNGDSFDQRNEVLRWWQIKQQASHQPKLWSYILDIKWYKEQSIYRRKSKCWKQTCLHGSWQRVAGGSRDSPPDLANFLMLTIESLNSVVLTTLKAKTCHCFTLNIFLAAPTCMSVSWYTWQTHTSASRFRRNRQTYQLAE